MPSIPTASFASSLPFSCYAANAIPEPPKSHVTSDAASVPPSYKDHVGGASSGLPSYQDHVERVASIDHTGSVYSANSSTQSRSGGSAVPPSKDIPPPLPPRKAPPSLPPHKKPLPQLPAFDPRPPSYEEHSRSSADGVRRPSNEGHSRISAKGPRQPSYEEHSRDSPNSGWRASHGGVGSEEEPGRDKEVVKAEARRSKWAMFVVGNLLSAGVVIFEISKLSVCFDGYVGDDDDMHDTDNLNAAIDSNATFTYGITMFTLVFGFWVELLSTFALSTIYRSPLDIKSVHKVPPDDLRHCGASIIVNFLAPFSWAVIYVSGGLASVYHSAHSSCKGQGGSGLELYLLLSGSFMMASGFGMLGISGFILICSCGSPTRATDRCCAVARRRIHDGLLTKGPYLHVFWQVQGAIWSYRAGGFGLASVLFVGLGGVFGELLSAFGSLAPDIVVQGLAGSLA